MYVCGIFGFESKARMQPNYVGFGECAGKVFHVENVKMAAMMIYIFNVIRNICHLACLTSVCVCVCHQNVKSWLLTEGSNCITRSTPTTASVPFMSSPVHTRFSSIPLFGTVIPFHNAKYAIKHFIPQQKLPNDEGYEASRHLIGWLAYSWSEVKKHRSGLCSFSYGHKGFYCSCLPFVCASLFNALTCSLVHSLLHCLAFSSSISLSLST